MQLTQFIIKIAKLALIQCRRAIYLVLFLLDTYLTKRTNPLFILSYHSVSSDSWRFSVSKALMIKQLTYLKKHYDIITLATLEKYLQGKIELTRPSVVITFDDGYADVLSLQPYFNKNKIKPALFVLADTKQPNWRELGTKRQFLTKNALTSLHKNGWEIGCHSATHANLASLSSVQLHDEVANAKKALEKQLGTVINYFAYPRGKYTDNVLKEMKKAKYTLALTMDDGTIKPGINAYTLPRIGVDGTHSYAEFKTLFSPSVVTFRKIIKKSPLGRFL